MKKSNCCSHLTLAVAAALLRGDRPAVTAAGALTPDPRCRETTEAHEVPRGGSSACTEADDTYHPPEPYAGGTVIFGISSRRHHL